jgi:lysozyme
MPNVTLTGPDVYEGSGDVDWVKVKGAGHDFAVVKATEGVTFTDPRFGGGRWSSLAQSGLVRGVYHYARPQPGRDPVAEVEHFHDTVQAAGGLKSGDLRPVLDLETSKGLTAAQILTWARGFVHAAHEAFGAQPIIYTGSFWRDAMGNPDDRLGAPLWLAAYVNDPTPYIPVAWKARGLSLWQHTDKGRVPGIPSPCDLNQFVGAQSDFAHLLIP